MSKQMIKNSYGGFLDSKRPILDLLHLASILIFSIILFRLSFIFNRTKLLILMIIIYSGFLSIFKNNH